MRRDGRDVHQDAAQEQFVGTRDCHLVDVIVPHHLMHMEDLVDVPLERSSRGGRLIGKVCRRAGQPGELADEADSAYITGGQFSLHLQAHQKVGKLLTGFPWRPIKVFIFRRVGITEARGPIQTFEAVLRHFPVMYTGHRRQVQQGSQVQLATKWRRLG